MQIVRPRRRAAPQDVPTDRDDATVIRGPPSSPFPLPPPPGGVLHVAGHLVCWRCSVRHAGSPNACARRFSRWPLSPLPSGTQVDLTDEALDGGDDDDDADDASASTRLFRPEERLHVRLLWKVSFSASGAIMCVRPAGEHAA